MALSIWTLNCQGLNNAVKRNSLNSLITKFSPDIVCLQETNINIAKCESFVLNSYKTQYNSATTLGSGTIFLVKNKFNITGNTILIPGKLQQITIDVFGQSFYFYNIHFPFKNFDSSNFLRILKSSINSCSGPDNVFLVGDWNFVLNEALDRLRSVERRKMVAREFSQICQNFNLFDAYRHLNPSGNDMTFFSKLKNHSEARLDRVYLNASHLPNLVNTNMFPFISDHIIFSILLKFDQFSDFKNLWVFPNHLLHNHDFNITISFLLNDFILKCDYTEKTYTFLKNKIVQIAMEMDISLKRRFRWAVKRVQRDIQQVNSDQDLCNADIQNFHR